MTKKKNILDDLDSKYWKYIRRLEEGGEFDYEDAAQQYEEELRKDFDNLSPDNRIEIFSTILKTSKHELEDCLVENHTADALKLMMIIQLLEQIVKVNKED